MARFALAIPLLALFVGLLATTTFASSAGEIPEEGDGDLESLPTESLGDVIGDDEAVSPDSSTPNADGALPPTAVAGGMGPSTGEDETTESSSSSSSSSGSPESSSEDGSKSTPDGEKNAGGTSTVKLTFAATSTFLVVMVILGF